MFTLKFEPILYLFLSVWMENMSKHLLASCSLHHSSQLNKHVRAKLRTDRNLYGCDHLFNLFQFIYYSRRKESKQCLVHFANISCPSSKEARNNMHHK